MRSILAAWLLLLITVGAANGQSADDLRISVEGFQVETHGAEKRSVGGSAAATIGTTAARMFSFRDCRRFSITHPPARFEKEADVAWRVEVTPLRVVDHAVTFRLRWTREIDKAGERPGENVEVTLKPGESRPIDTVAIPPGTRDADGRPCEMQSASLRVSVDFPEMDRRLIDADIWLVERLPGGQERSQQQSIRGLPHRPIPFFFDGIADGGARLDVFGELIARPGAGAIQVALKTAAARAHAGQSGYQAARWFRSTLNIKPTDTIDVALTREGEKPPASAGRNLSIRLRVRQSR